MVPPNDCKILVIDPDPAIRTLLVALLRRGGIDTDCAGDHDSALERLAAQHYAAVILEPRMPRGDALLRALRAAPSDAKPSIIIATTPDTMSGVTAQRDGVEAVLLKPFHLDELYAAVAEQCAAV